MNKLAVSLLVALLPALTNAETPKAKKSGMPEGFHELKIGDAAPDFELIGIDEEKHTLKDYADADLLLIAFLSNHCPTSQAVEGRIKKLVKDYKGKGLKLVAINPNDPAALRPDELGYSKYNDSFPEMKRHAKEQDFNFPYLYDGDTQKTALAYGCLATPHVMIFDKERKLRYQGRLDDSRYDDDATVTSPDARNAIEALVAGKPVPVAETKLSIEAKSQKLFPDIPLQDFEQKWKKFDWIKYVESLSPEGQMTTLQTELLDPRSYLRPLFSDEILEKSKKELKK